MFCTHYDIPFWPTRRTARVSTVVMTIAALIVFVWAMVGCADQTSARKAYISVEGATVAVKGVTLAYDAKVLTREQVAALQPYAHAVKAAQDSLDAAILSGKVDLASYSQALTDAVAELLNQQAKVKSLPPAATQPQ